MLTKKSRGFPYRARSPRYRFAQGRGYKTLLFRTSYSNLLSDIPDKAAQLAGDSRGHLVVMNAAGTQPAKSRTKPNLGLPGGCHDVLRLPFESWLQRFANASGKAVVPRRFNQDAPNVRIAGLGEPATVACWPARMLAWDQAEISHQFAGMGEAAQIAEFGDNGHGGQQVDAAQGHQRLDHRQRAPRLNLSSQ